MVQDVNKMIPSRQDRTRIAAASSVDDRSILRTYRGEPVRQATIRRVAEAAVALGITPPAQSRAPSLSMDDLAERVRAEVARLAPLLPDIDPHDLALIVERRLRPWGTGQRFFIRRTREGHYVF